MPANLVNAGVKNFGMSAQLEKKIITPGDGVTKPQAGRKVTVHYDGRFPDGKQFDSSRNRGKPFQFTLGAGEVIKGWDQGVATMTVGEKALFTIPYQLAYGEHGHPPIIPPKATLVFEVELLAV